MYATTVDDFPEGGVVRSISTEYNTEHHGLAAAVLTFDKQPFPGSGIDSNATHVSFSHPHEFIVRKTIKQLGVRCTDMLLP